MYGPLNPTSLNSTDFKLYVFYISKLKDYIQNDLYDLNVHAVLEIKHILFQL
jgi:hypothetical protein